jgi:hypothetical protein
MPPLILGIGLYPLLGFMAVSLLFLIRLSLSENLGIASPNSNIRSGGPGVESAQTPGMADKEIRDLTNYGAITVILTIT